MPKNKPKSKPDTQTQPPRRKGRLLLWPAIIVVMAIAVYLTKPAGKTAEEAKERFEDAIRREVPPAASRADVENWFNHHGILHTYLDYVNADRRSVPGEKGMKSMAEIAGLRNEDLSGMVRGAINCPSERAGIGESGRMTIYFFFDKQQTVAGHLVDWMAFSLQQGQ